MYKVDVYNLLVSLHSPKAWHNNKKTTTNNMLQLVAPNGNVLHAVTLFYNKGWGHLSLSVVPFTKLHDSINSFSLTSHYFCILKWNPNMFIECICLIQNIISLTKRWYTKLVIKQPLNWLTVYSFRNYHSSYIWNSLNTNIII